MDVKCPGCYRITTVSFPNIAKAPFSFIAGWWCEYHCRCSLTRRLWSSARDAPPSSASPPGVGPGSLKVSISIRIWLGEGQGWQWPTNDLSLNIAFTFVYKKGRENNFHSYIPQDDAVLLIFDSQGDYKGKSFATGNGDKVLADNRVSWVELGLGNENGIMECREWDLTCILSGCSFRRKTQK